MIGYRTYILATFGFHHFAKTNSRETGAEIAGFWLQQISRSGCKYQVPVRPRPNGWFFGGFRDGSGKAEDIRV